MSEVLFPEGARMALIGDLKPNPRNARTHSQKQLGEIKSSIEEFGWTVPILIDDQNSILAGHARFEAARMMGLESVPVIQIVHMTDVQKRAYILADNKLALNSGWDESLLAEELLALSEEGFDVALAGFDDLDGLGTNESDAESFKEFDESIQTEHRCPSCGYTWSGSTK